MAPFIAALIKAGLPVLAGAVATKGKELVEEKLGVNIEGMLGSEEGKLKLRELELKHKEFLIEAAHKDKQLDNANTADARAMNSAIQASEHASELAKTTAYYLDYIIVLATIGLAYIIFLSDVKLINQELAYTAFGSLLTMCGTILNFHRGTSRGSSVKDETITKLVNKNEIF